MLAFFMNSSIDGTGTLVMPGFVSFSTFAPLAFGSTILDITFFSNGAFNWNATSTFTIDLNYS